MADLTQFLETVRQKHHVPALAVAVLQNGAVTTAASGIRKEGESATVTVDDKFHFGSCGKAVTAALIHQLADEGRFTLESKLTELLPGLKIDPSYQNITVSELLTHTSGLPGDYYDLVKLHQLAQTTPAPEIRKMMMEEVLATPPAAPVTKTYGYSNVGYTLLGMIAERATGQAFEDLVRQRIFEPLGMRSAGFGLAANGTNPSDQPYGHSHDANHALSPVQLDNPTAYAPAGTMHASPADWMKFLKSRMVQWRVVDHPYHVVPDGKGQHYTDSGFIQNAGVLAHDGSNTLNYARQVLLPKQDAAFIVVTNDGSEHAQQAVEEVTAHIARQVIQTKTALPDRTSAVSVRQ